MIIETNVRLTVDKKKHYLFSINRNDIEDYNENLYEIDEDMINVIRRRGK